MLSVGCVATAIGTIMLCVYVDKLIKTKKTLAD